MQQLHIDGVHYARIHLMREHLHFQEPDLVIRIEEQIAIFGLARRELIGKCTSVPSRFGIEMVFARVGVTRVMVGIHEHRELELLGP